ncbi:tyrosine-type recombinase/integrase [Herbiconiux moechotypicola]|uniref:Site-specific integrase n=1 Tax=Herbiconiux moechotypicola TaxID=637393 RepID=A0ABN3DFX8_9MICO|nr:site-specific integrase [Herbiconiux moechotypicola]MCS5729457.1 tyrosine-type recombinase/integrase [Herbiconiux moechotypicola]
MSGKRANGDGSLRKRSDGRWESRFSYIDAATGETKRVTSYGRTQAEARARMAEKRKRVDEGKPATDSAVKLGAFADSWVRSTLAASGRKDSTKATYSTLARGYLMKGKIAEVPLARLRARDVEELLLAMRADGKAPSTVRQAYTVLRAVLDAAVRDGAVAKNVAAQVGRPGVPRVEARALSAAELARLLSAIEGGPFEDLVRFLALTGLRRGEALALRWSAVDLDRRVAHIRGTLGQAGREPVVSEPKSARSRRTVALSPTAIQILRGVEEKQRSARERACDRWVERDFVFTTAVGSPLDPRNALRAVQSGAQAAGLEGEVGLHTLRHTAASMMLAAGVPITEVSAMLGHSSIAITGDIYGHVTHAGQRSAADVLAAALTPTLTPTR